MQHLSESTQSKKAIEEVGVQSPNSDNIMLLVKPPGDVFKTNSKIEPKTADNLRSMGVKTHH